MSVKRNKSGRFLKGSDPLNKNDILFNFKEVDWNNLYIKQNLSTFKIAKNIILMRLLFIDI